MRVDRAARTRHRAAPTPVASERRAGANDRERRRSRRRAATRADPRRARDPGRARRARATTRAAPRRAPVRGWAMMMRELSPSRGDPGGVANARGDAPARHRCSCRPSRSPGSCVAPRRASGDRERRRARETRGREWIPLGRPRAESGTPRGAGVLFDAYEMSPRKQSTKKCKLYHRLMEQSEKKEKTRRRVLFPDEDRRPAGDERPFLAGFFRRGRRFKPISHHAHIPSLHVLRTRSSSPPHPSALFTRTYRSPPAASSLLSAPSRRT